MIFYALLGAIIYAIYYVFVRPLKCWEKLNIPYVPGYPVVGNYLATALQTTSMGEAVREIYQRMSRHHKIFGTFFFTTPMLVISDPDLIKTITIKDFENYLDHSEIFFKKEEHPILANNLFALNGSKWRDMRATLSPTFTGSKMRIMFQLIEKCTDQMLQTYKNLAKQNSKDILDVELHEMFQRMGNDVIASAAFGVEVNSFKDPENEFYQMGVKATTLNTFRMLIVNSFSTLAAWLKFSTIPDVYCGFFSSLIKNTMKMREENNIVRPDMLNVLMDLRKGELQIDASEENDADKLKGKIMALSDDDVTAQAFIFFLAGFDTTSNANSFLTYELALNPDVQQRLYEEIMETDKNCNGKVTYDVLLKMKYMDMVFQETMRKWPPAVSTDRVVTRPVTLDVDGKKVSLPVGTILQIPIFGFHRDAKYFPDPEVFDPERFSDDNKDKIQPYTYLPFGLGPRKCIGSRFAIMQSKLAVFNLIKTFEIVTTPKSTIPPVLQTDSINFRIQNGFNVGLRIRSNK